MKNRNKNRIYNLDRPIIAITGGVSSGKSLLCQRLKELNYFVLKADDLVKEIYHQDETKNFISTLAPQCLENDKIQFPVLRKLFFEDQTIKQKIEEYIYSKLEKTFLNSYGHISQFTHNKYFFYEIPLLFEKKLQDKFDFIILIYTTKENQINRTIQRDKVDREIVENIMANQINTEEKKILSHYLIENNGTIDDLYKKIDQLCLNLKNTFSTSAI